jgi:hypothetical protein
VVDARRDSVQCLVLSLVCDWFANPLVNGFEQAESTFEAQRRRSQVPSCSSARDFNSGRRTRCRAARLADLHITICGAVRRHASPGLIRFRLPLHPRMNGLLPIVRPDLAPSSFDYCARFFVTSSGDYHLLTLWVPGFELLLVLEGLFQLYERVPRDNPIANRPVV